MLWGPQSATLGVLGACTALHCPPMSPMPSPDPVQRGSNTSGQSNSASYSQPPAAGGAGKNYFMYIGKVALYLGILDIYRKCGHWSENKICLYTEYSRIVVVGPLEVDHSKVGQKWAKLLIPCILVVKCLIPYIPGPPGVDGWRVMCQCADATMQQRRYDATALRCKGAPTH
jgi:hypothetical protein